MNSKKDFPPRDVWLTVTQRHRMENENFTICNWKSNTHFRLRYLMQAFSHGVKVAKDQFHDNCFKGNKRSVTPCLNASIFLVL